MSLLDFDIYESTYIFKISLQDGVEGLLGEGANDGDLGYGKKLR